MEPLRAWHERRLNNNDTDLNKGVNDEYITTAAIAQEPPVGGQTRSYKTETAESTGPATHSLPPPKPATLAYRKSHSIQLRMATSKPANIFLLFLLMKSVRRSNAKFDEVDMKELFRQRAQHKPQLFLQYSQGEGGQ